MWRGNRLRLTIAKRAADTTTPSARSGWRPARRSNTVLWRSRMPWPSTQARQNRCRKRRLWSQKETFRLPTQPAAIFACRVHGADGVVVFPAGGIKAGMGVACACDVVSVQRLPGGQRIPPYPEFIAHRVGDGVPMQLDRILGRRGRQLRWDQTTLASGRRTDRRGRRCGRRRRCSCRRTRRRGR